MPRTTPAIATTRERIRDAAAALFAERGYATASVRDIAQRAGADPSLVIRHFGSKELLFLETMHVSIDDEPLFDVPLESLGRRVVEVLLDQDERTRSTYLALVRGGHEPSIAERLRTTHVETFVAPLRARLSGPDADLRARLAAALVGGLLYSLWVVGDEALLAADPVQTAATYGGLLQQLLTPAAA